LSSSQQRSLYRRDYVPKTNTDYNWIVSVDYTFELGGCKFRKVMYRDIWIVTPVPIVLFKKSIIRRGDTRGISMRTRENIHRVTILQLDAHNRGHVILIEMSRIDPHWLTVSVRHSIPVIYAWVTI